MNIETTMRKDKPAETAVIRHDKTDADISAREMLKNARAAVVKKDDATKNHD